MPSLRSANSASTISAGMGSTTIGAGTSRGGGGGGLGAGFGGGAPAFGPGAGDAGVGLSLIGAQASADILPHVNVGNVNRHDLERRVRIELPAEHLGGDLIGIFEYLHVIVGLADRADDAL